MRKRIKTRKLSRSRDQRKALRKSLMSEFFLHEKIKTTEAKAKEIQPLVEKIITSAKSVNYSKSASTDKDKGSKNKEKGGISQRRSLGKVFSAEIVKKIIEEIAPKFKNRNGGYTRIIKIGARKSDSAKIAIIELVK